MNSKVAKLKVAALVLAVVAVLVSVPQMAEAAKPSAQGKALNVQAELTETCNNCATDAAPKGGSGPYSVRNDDAGPYTPGNGVQSQILTHNAVYTLDTMDTLVNGKVGAGTRYVKMHFYTSVSNQLPACWLIDANPQDQNQAVNWSVFSQNTMAFTDMVIGQSYPGFSRMDFNVRNDVCDREIFRFYLRWSNVCIKRTGDKSWEVTSDTCGRATNYGEATLEGQGGKKKETVNYGDWRMPFQLLLSAP